MEKGANMSELVLCSEKKGKNPFLLKISVMMQIFTLIA